MNRLRQAGLRRPGIYALLAAVLGIGVGVALFQIADDEARSATPEMRSGGIFRVVALRLDVGPIDPALEYRAPRAPDRRHDVCAAERGGWGHRRA